jgi:hypothetical protein
VKPQRLAYLSIIAAVGALATLAGCASARPAASGGAVGGSSRPGVEAPARPASLPSAVGPSGSSGSQSEGHGGAAAPAAVPAAKLPGNAVQSWRPIAPAQSHPVTHDMRLNECQTVHGANTWQQQGYESSQHTPGVQDTFLFANATAADTAYQALLTAMSSCQDRSRALQTEARLPVDASVTETAQSTAGAAWARQWTAAGGISAPGAQTNHIYLARRGPVVTVLQITELPGKTPTNAIDTREDGAVLSTLAANLAP